MKKLLTYSFFLISFLPAIGCQGYSITGGPGKAVPVSAQVEQELPGAILSVHSVYIAPVTFEQGVKNTQALSEILTGTVRRDARKSLDIEVLEAEAAEPAFKGTSVQAFIQEARRYGETLGAEAVLFTQVQQFTTRIGSAAAAERGAHVAFTMELRSVSGGDVVWKGSYSFRDQALSQNFLRLGERVKEEGRSGWWTAEELFDRGAGELLTRLQNDRIQQFTRK